MSAGKIGPLDGFFIYVAEKLNGYKSLSGIVLIAGGAATVIFTPEYKEAGYNMISAGVTLLFVGVAHKSIKKVEGE